MLKLEAMFGDNAVLQRDVPIPVYGTAPAGQSVSVELGGRVATTAAGPDGHWTATLPAFRAGGPYTLKVSSGTEELQCRNVLIGDVWFCSGQSNMEWTMKQLEHAEADRDIAEAYDPQLRVFTVFRAVGFRELTEGCGRWATCEPENVPGFSAVAYYFARHIRPVVGVPVGLVVAAWGGSPIAPWLPRDTIAHTHAFAHLNRSLLSLENDTVNGKNREANHPRNHAGFYVDTGNEGEGKGWAKVDFDDSAWQELMLPMYWQEIGMFFNGAVWFRKTLNIPESWAGQKLVLELGAVDDFDTTYFNGQLVGSVGADDPNAFIKGRKYPVPASLVTAGKAVVATRVFDHFGNGGVVGPAPAMRIYPEGRVSEAIGLGHVAWRMHVERAITPWLSSTLSSGPSMQYNGMVYPYTRSAIKGVLWYQGESDTSRAQFYRTLLPALIDGWRNAWKNPDLPFYFVQLANYKDPSPEPGPDDWAELRDAQLYTLRRVPHTGMAVTIDVGDAKDIHPRNKREVGRRLALIALADVYGRSGAYSGPIYRSHEIKDGAARISFDHDAGLRARNGSDLKGFAIAGEDRVFHWADARIEGSAVVVSSPKVADPKAVRYGWQSNPTCNLENASGLPASPFRTDDWPGVTHGA